MEQKLIGRFIANCRKEKNMTQVQFAEKLGVTNKAVSKWETGRCWPDANLFDDICLVLDITLNELFAGEKIEPQNIEKKAEENLVNIATEVQHRKQFVRWIEAIIGGLIIVIFMINISVGGMWFEGTPVVSNCILSILFIAAWISIPYLSQKNMVIQKILIFYEGIVLVSSVIALGLSFADVNSHVVFWFTIPYGIFLYGLRLIFSWFHIYIIAIGLSVFHLLYIRNK